MSKKGKRHCTLLNLSYGQRRMICVHFRMFRVFQIFLHMAFLLVIPWKITVTIQRENGIQLLSWLFFSWHHSYTMFSSAFLGKFPCHSDLCQHQWKAEHKWQLGCNYQSCQTSVSIELVHKCCFPQTSLAAMAVGSSRWLEWVFEILSATWQLSRRFHWPKSSV